jgi:hypothetical protein
LTAHTHPVAAPSYVPDCPACEAEIDAYLEAQDLAEATAYVRHYGIASYIARLRYEEEEAALYDACRVTSFQDDPITRSASFDSYELAGLTAPMVTADAAAGCLLCQRELAADR